MHESYNWISPEDKLPKKCEPVLLHIKKVDWRNKNLIYIEEICIGYCQTWDDRLGKKLKWFVEVRDVNKRPSSRHRVSIIQECIIGWLPIPPIYTEKKEECINRFQLLDME